MISIIIPTFNEESSVEQTLKRLHSIKCKVEKEIIVSDGGSTDKTVEIAEKYAIIVYSEKGKAKQLNRAVKLAKGDILFFAHADMIVPDGALTAICDQLSNEKYHGGGFANMFDESNKKIKRLGAILNLRVFSRKEQSDRNIFYGDNGIFVKKEVFNALGGFKDIPIMEDYDFSVRMKSGYRVKQIRQPRLIVSARRHLKAGFLKTRFQWIVIRKLYKLGVPPQKLVNWYSDVR